MKNKLGDKCFCDNCTVNAYGNIKAEVDGVLFDASEYNCYADFVNAIIQRVYNCAMGKLN